MGLFFFQGGSGNNANWPSCFSFSRSSRRSRKFCSAVGYTHTPHLKIRSDALGYFYVSEVIDELMFVGHTRLCMCIVQCASLRDAAVAIRAVYRRPCRESGSPSVGARARAKTFAFKGN